MVVIIVILALCAWIGMAKHFDKIGDSVEKKINYIKGEEEEKNKYE